MNRRRLTGWIALVLLLLAGLTWYEVAGRRQETTTAFAPSRSADESAPVPEAPMAPPAELAAKEPPAEPAARSAEPPAAEAPSQQPPPAAVAKAEPSAPAGEPAKPEPKVPAAAAEPAPPETVPTFDVVRVDPTGETVIAGLAEPNAKVEILDGTAPIATADANDRGEWAIALDKALPPGTHDLSVRTTSKNRSISVLSDQRVAVQVPESGSKDVLVVLNAPDAASRVLQVPPVTEPKAPAVATAEPAPPPSTEPQPKIVAEAPVGAEPPIKGEPPIKAEPPVAAEPQIAAVPPATQPEPLPAVPAQPVVPPKPEPAVALAAVEADTAGGLYIAGTAVTGETVRVYFEDEMIGEAEPSPSGTWLLQVHREVAPGTYRIRADQIAGLDGKVIARAEVPFERAINVASLKATGTMGAASGSGVSGRMPEVDTVIIKRGDNLWRIARNAWGKGIRWSNIYQVNRDQIRNPRRIYPGQVFMMPKLGSSAKN